MEASQFIHDPEFRIIVIDDNTAIHSDFIKILSNGNESKNSDSEFNTLSMKMFGKKNEDVALPKFEIHTASQGQEGVAYIAEAVKQNKPYSLAFVDIRMPPGWDGIETIKHIWAIDKDIQIVICTAYSDYSWEETVAHLGKTDNLLILKKPFDNISVRQLACALTKKWQLLQKTRQYTHELQQKISDRTFSLEKSLSLIKSTFESSSDGILVVNRKGEIIDYNHKFIDLLEIPKDILKTKKEKDVYQAILNSLQSSDEFAKKLNEFQQDPTEISIDVIRFKNGKVFECYSQPHRLNNEIVGRILDFRDITKRAKLEEELQFQATHDALTGLENRVLLLERIQKAIKNSADNATQFVVIFLDLDRFKLINDSLSHEIGDQVLKKVARRFQKIIRKNDIVSRLGGDEFILVFFNMEKKKDILNKIRQIFKIFQKPFQIAERKITLTASLGVSIYPQDGDTSNILLRNADAAMYKAKTHKGNNFQFYSPEMNTQTLATLDQEMELRRAIDQNEFFLVYQPQIDLTNEKLVAVEALIRWQHPTKGVLLPIDFIPLAEDTGLIVKMGEWVLRKACEQAFAWQQMGLPPLRIAVNLTAQQFKSENIIDLIKDILAETNLAPKYLELELTENVIISNPEILRIVRELKKIGVSIAIDDFGTGYSSLNYLHKIPLDRLKIDSSFIQHIQTASDDEAIIRAVIAMAKSLNLEVLAEGVETPDQVNFLKKYECGDVQGFYFSKPLNSNELEKFLRHPDQVTDLAKKNHSSSGD